VRRGGEGKGGGPGCKGGEAGSGREDNDRGRDSIPSAMFCNPDCKVKNKNQCAQILVKNMFTQFNILILR